MLLFLARFFLYYFTLCCCSLSLKRTPWQPGAGLCGQTLSGIRGVYVIWPTSTCSHACAASPPLPAVAACGLHLKFKWRKISACGARCVQTVSQLPMPLTQSLQASTTQGKDFICNINRSLIPLPAAAAAPLLSLR